MTFIRQLDTNTKLYACLAIVLCLGLLAGGWLLAQLGQMSELLAAASGKHGPGAVTAAESARALLGAARSGSMFLLAAGAALTVMLGLWLAAEAARPIHAAVLVARRVAAGDLGARIEAGAKGEAGLLMRALQEMNDKLVEMVVDVRSGTQAIASGSDEIARGSMDLSGRTGQQAASLEETASSMEQLTATVKQNADHAHQASKLAVSASQVAVKGGEVVAEVVGTMASINDSSKRIAEIIGVIDAIAFQTNILALNAAVEAARAGEQGRGFAVVASEVRNLAQRSAAAAKEIKALIDDSVEKVSAGTQLADKAGKTMNEVVMSVKRVTDIIGEIADASAEQTAGIDQVNHAIAAMDQATQRNAALVEESAAAAAAMREHAASLSRVSGAFVLGAGPGAGPGAPGTQMRLVGANAAKQAEAKAAPGRAGAARPGATRKAAPARAAAAGVAPAAAAAVSGPARRSAASQEVDWEEF